MLKKIGFFCLNVWLLCYFQLMRVHFICPFLMLRACAFITLFGFCGLGFLLVMLDTRVKVDFVPILQKLSAVCFQWPVCAWIFQGYFFHSGRCVSRSSAAADATSVCSFYSTQTPIFVLHPGKRCLFKSPKTTFVNVSADTDATLLISGSAFIRNEDTALIKLSISFPLKWVLKWISCC